MKKHIRAFVSLLCAAALALGCASCGGAAQSTGKSGGTAGVTHITVWTYYNGDQLESFNKLVDQFNETTGREKGIRVESASQGRVSDLETNVMDAAQGKVGAAAMPNIFSAYADTAYALDQMGMLVDLSQYLTEDERAQYVQGYLDEGDFDGDGRRESMVFANTPWDENGWWELSEQDGGAFALALLLREDGAAETIYSRFADYTGDMTAIYRLQPIGAYDLDGDGTAEVCMTIGYWEGAEHLVLRRQDGRWETVLNAASGM